VPLAAQVSAPLPIAAFHDVRFILVFASSWWFLALALAGALAARATLLAGLAAAAWPCSTRPGWRALLVRNAVGEALLLAAMSPWAVLAFAAGLSSVAYPLLAGIAGAALTGAVALPHAGITRRWWHRLASPREIAWVAASFAASAIAGLAVGASPPGLSIVAATGGGVANAWCLEHLVRASAAPARQARRPRTVAVPVVLALTLIVLPIGAASGLDEVGASFPMRPAPPQAAPRRGQQVVMIVDGFDSRWDGGAPLRSFPGFYTTEFSYAGQARDGRPLDYDSADTFQSLTVLAARFASQVRRLARLSGQDVDVVAISEGTLVVRAFLGAHRRPPLGVVVLASPLLRPDRVWYPPAGASGPGLAAAAEARLLLAVPHAENPIDHFGLELPLARSLLDDAPLYRQRSLCPVPGVAMVALVPFTAAFVDPPGPVSGVPSEVVPATHATIVTSGVARRTILDVLEEGGATLASSAIDDGVDALGLAFQAVRYAASAFEVPSLPLDAVAAWRTAGGDRWGDTASGSYGCPASDVPGAGIAPVPLSGPAGR
jgi:hypothetical protein